MASGIYTARYAGQISRHTECRSCGAPIMFIRLTSGKENPVDVDSLTHVVPDSAGTSYVTITGDVIKGREVEDGGIQAYTSHFATCPNAAMHRKGRRKAQ